MATRNERVMTVSALLAALAFGVAGAGCDGGGSGADAGLDVTVPAECSGCPRDCCRLPDAGYACMSFDHRNALTMECSCGTGPACEQPRTCCPPDNNPAPQLPATCVDTPGLCDPRPTGM